MTLQRQDKPMTDGRRQLEKVMELMEEGSTRRIHLLVIAVLALSGMALQGLVYWYAAQMVGKEWGALGIQVWAFALGAWILTVGLALALLRKRLKDMQEGSDLGGVGHVQLYITTIGRTNAEMAKSVVGVLPQREPG